MAYPLGVVGIAGGSDFAGAGGVGGAGGGFGAGVGMGVGVGGVGSSIGGATAATMAST